MYVFYELAIREAGVAEKSKISDGVVIVVVIPLNRYSIWRELYKVSTAHVSLGLVEVGLLIFPNIIEIVEDPATYEGKHSVPNYMYKVARRVNDVHVEMGVPSTEN